PPIAGRLTRMATSTATRPPSGGVHRVATHYRSSVGKKVMMGVSGLLLFGFLVAHMLCNLMALQEPEAFNGYALFLRQVGYPAVPHYGVVWVLRVGLLAAVLVHVFAAFQLWSRSRAARPAGYRREKNLSFTYASRTMRWGGVIILL